jgi:hypothetical protein
MESRNILDNMKRALINFEPLNLELSNKRFFGGHHESN